jgi:orotate phosphoribosyltransferase
MDKASLLGIFRETEALLEGHFVLASGLHSPQYFQCAKVLQYPEHMETLCNEIAEHFKPSSVQVVISPAIGGIVVGQEVGRQLNARTIFAEREEGKMKLRRGFEIKIGERVLVCEDVTTTGGSAVEVINIVKQASGTVAGVACIVDRSNGKIKFDAPQFSLLQMNVETYKPEDCQLCKENIPLVKPGSRK